MRHRANWWDLRAQADDGTGGGGGTVEPAAAREFVRSFVPDPAVLDSMKDEDVLAYHGSVTQALNGHVQKANDSRDWRKELADDENELKTLGRFASPKDVWRQNKEFQTKLSKGEMRLVKEFPATGTDEEKNTWRAQNGIPPDGKYELKLPQELKIAEQDQPLVERFTKYAHETNMPASEVNKAATWFFKERAEREQQAAEAFEARKQETAAELGSEWGADYKGTKNKIAGVLDATIPSDQAEVRELIQRAIDTNPTVARHYAAIALQLNPAGTLVPGDRGANEATIADELKKYDKMIRENRSEWNKDNAAQARQLELLSAYERMTGKSWGQP